MVNKNLFFFQLVLVICLVIDSYARDSHKNTSMNRTELVKLENQPQPDLGNGYYQNPILAGEYPDPSIIRVEKDYYMTHTPLRGRPGLLIWHSRDLVNWEPITNAISDFIGDIWAPEILYYNKLYYIYFPARVDSPDGETTRSNFVITAEDPAGPWSNVTDLKVGHIDPGHIADLAGNRFLYLSGGRMIPLTADGLQTNGELKKIYDGWDYPQEWNVECKCLESPKLFYRQGYYYMVSAQGGTAGPSTSHMIVVARSKSPTGPWVNSPLNPLLRTENRDEAWWSQGHGTLIDAVDGSWWVVYHAYANGFRTHGRSTLLMPVEWTEDGWPQIPKGINSSDPIKKTAGENVGHGLPLSDDFSGEKPGLQWRYWENEKPGKAYQLDNGQLAMEAKGSSAADASKLTCFPVNSSYTAEVEIILPETAEAGLLLHYNQDHYAGFAATTEKLFSIRRSQPGRSVEWKKNRVFMRIQNRNHDVDFFYSNDGKNWTRHSRGIEMSAFHHNAFGGFNTLKIALYAAGEGRVIFKNFVYRGIREGNMD